MLLWKCSLNMPSNLENSAVATGLEKVSFHSNPKERQFQRMFKLLHNCTHLNASKEKLKILQARLQQDMNCELSNVQAGLEKAEGPEIKLLTSAGSLKKQESSRKTSISALLTMPKPWRCGSQSTVENSERDGNTRPPDLPIEKSVCRSRNNS